MTSSSSLGSTRIILQFDFDRDINGAARDVQAAINAAQSLLPSGMPQPPDLSQSEPVGCANYDPHADVRYLFAG